MKMQIEILDRRPALLDRDDGALDLMRHVPAHRVRKASTLGSLPTTCVYSRGWINSFSAKSLHGQHAAELCIKNVSILLCFVENKSRHASARATGNTFPLHNYRRQLIYEYTATTGEDRYRVRKRKVGCVVTTFLATKSWN